MVFRFGTRKFSSMRHFLQVFTFETIGTWMRQKKGPNHGVVRFYESCGYSLEEGAKKMQQLVETISGFKEARSQILGERLMELLAEKKNPQKAKVIKLKSKKSRPR